MWMTTIVDVVVVFVVQFGGKERRTKHFCDQSNLIFSIFQSEICELQFLRITMDRERWNSKYNCPKEKEEKSRRTTGSFNNTTSPKDTISTTIFETCTFFYNYYLLLMNECYLMMRTNLWN